MSAVLAARLAGLPIINHGEMWSEIKKAASIADMALELRAARFTSAPDPMCSPETEDDRSTGPTEREKVSPCR